ncbi:hypothetical protein [Burkholderia plantarii]|uniref:hypothetical protein n=1 Tax=Burkholderia plantarii TaxID=41899 RepID=UPI0018DDC5C4|nr:hypothetical protein [Burkholderia plantarii]MBI0329644.1 hypothetical protein [Burkholderia plantarii]
MSENHALTQNAAYDAHVIDHEMSLQVDPIVQAFLEAKQSPRVQTRARSSISFVRSKPAEGCGVKQRITEPWQEFDRALPPTSTRGDSWVRACTCYPAQRTKP